jgi:nicotinamide-nucleotide amidase
VRSAVVAVGDELLLGDIVNGNAAWLGARLAEVGAPVVHSSAVGDDVARIVTALRRALEDADVVVTTGGLGPTVDDVTRDAVALVAGVPLDRSAELEQQLRDRFAAYGIATLPAQVMRQADVPRGATVLDNPVGSAPGLRLEVEGRLLIALPGPPHELAGTLSAEVLADLAARSGEIGLTRTLHCAGVGESQVAEVVDELLDLPPRVDLAYLAAGGVVRVRLTTTAPTLEQAAALLDPYADAVASALGSSVFGRDDSTLPTAVVRRLAARGQTVAVAESLTAGLAGAALTEVPGSSAVFRGGVQVYATDLKARLAGVPQDVLDAHGAVSAQTAAAMADGVRRACDADWGLALTGVAGPDSQEGQPPGTVHVAVAGPGGQTGVRSRRLPGDRQRVRLLAVTLGLDLLRRRLG